MRARAHSGRRVALAVCVAVALSGCSRRAPPGVILPEPRGKETPRELSRAGQNRGDLELGLGAVVTAVSATLVVLGSFGAKKAADLRAYCGSPALPTFIDDPDRTAACTDPLGFNPVRAAAISSALAFAFAIPIAVGGGFLLRNGVRLRKDFKASKAVQRDMSLRPWVDGRRGAGLGFSLRF